MPYPGARAFGGRDAFFPEGAPRPQTVKNPYNADDFTPEIADELRVNRQEILGRIEAVAAPARQEAAFDHDAESAELLDRVRYVYQKADMFRGARERMLERPDDEWRKQEALRARNSLVHALAALGIEVSEQNS